MKTTKTFDFYRKTILPVLLTSVLLCGCATAVPAETTTPAPVTTASTTPEETTQVPVTETETTEKTTLSPKEQTALLCGRREKGEYSGEVYRLPEHPAFPDGAEYSATTQGEHHIYVIYAYEKRMHAMIFDFSDGTWQDADLCADAQYLTYDDTSFIISYEMAECGEDGCFLWGNGSLTFYDSAYQPIASVEFPAGDYECPVSAGGKAVSVREDGVYVADPENGLRILPIETCLYGSCLGRMPDGLLLIRTRDELSVDSLFGMDEDGTIVAEPTYTGQTSARLLGDKLFLMTGNTADVFDLNDNSAVGRFSFLPAEAVYAAWDDLFLTVTIDYDENFNESLTLRLYSYDCAEPVETLTVTSYLAGWVGKLSRVGEGIVFWPNAHEEGSRGYLWIPASLSGEVTARGTAPERAVFPCEKVGLDPAALSGIAMYGDPTYYKEKHYPLADTVLDTGTYAIGVRCGDSVMMTDFNDYRVTKLLNPDSAEYALSLFSSMLASFPEGLVDEVIRPFAGMELYLVDGIYPNGGDSIESVAAFTNCIDNVLVMVVPVSQATTSNFAHEFMHLMDRAVDARWDSVGMSSFCDLNPEGFSYVWSYHDENGAEIDNYTRPEYTSWDERSDTDLSVVYFTDGYATTFPTEDRARCFEYLVTGDAFWYGYLDYPNLRAKCERLCELLRENFACLSELAEEDVPVWEECLSWTWNVEWDPNAVG